IDRCSTEGNALGLTVIQRSPVTAITHDIVVLPCVLHCQFSTTTPAAQQTTQKSQSILNSAGLVSIWYTVAYLGRFQPISPSTVCTGNWSSCSKYHNNVWRTVPSSENLRYTDKIAS